VQFPICEHLDLSKALIEEVAAAKLEMVGISPGDGRKLPAELSGGMVKRVALAARSRLIPRSCFSTSRPPASTR